MKIDRRFYEQFEGRVATASDRYAFGCIAYQLLTGSVPFPLEELPRRNRSSPW